MKLIVWHNLKKDTYYFRLVSGYYKNYFVGYRNRYNHEVILVVNNIYKLTYKASLKRRLIKRFIRFLEKL